MAQNTKKKGKEGERNGVRDEKERENFSRRERTTDENSNAASTSLVTQTYSVC